MSFLFFCILFLFITLFFIIWQLISFYLPLLLCLILLFALSVQYATLALHSVFIVNIVPLYRKKSRNLQPYIHLFPICHYFYHNYVILIVSTYNTDTLRCHIFLFIILYKEFKRKNILYLPVYKTFAVFYIST